MSNSEPTNVGNASRIARNKTAAYLLLGREIKALKDQQEELKLDMEPYLREAETNARGSHVIDFGEPLEIDGTRYKGLQKVRKQSKVLDEDAVKAWAYKTLTERQINDLIVAVEHVDQDVLWNLFVNDELTQDEFDGMFVVNESWSFLPTKE